MGHVKHDLKGARVEKWSERIRWLLVIPAAVFASITVRLFVGGVVSVFPRGSHWTDPASLFFWIRAVANYVLPEIALVIAGVGVAPRFRTAVACCTALSGAVLSLLTHLVLPSRAGHRVGWANWTHFSLEFAGLFVGLIFVFAMVSGLRNVGREAGADATAPL